MRRCVDASSSRNVSMFWLVLMSAIIKRFICVGEHEQVGLWSSSEPEKCGKGVWAALFKDSMLKIVGFNLSMEMWSQCVVKSNVKYFGLQSAIRYGALYAGCNE